MFSGYLFIVVGLVENGTVTSPGTMLITMMEEHVFGEGQVSNMTHHALHHKTDGAENVYKWMKFIVI